MPIIHPPFDEIRPLAGRKGKLPLWTELLADFRTPLAVFCALKQAGTEAFLLESVEGGEAWGRYSFLGFTPAAVLTGRGRAMSLRTSEGVREFDASPFDAARELVDAGSAARFPELPPFTGGVVGCFGYETVCAFEDTLTLTGKDTTGLPDCVLMLFDELLVFDHLRQKLLLIVNIDADGDLAAGYDAGSRRLGELTAQVEEAAATIVRSEPLPPIAFTSNRTKEQYMAMVERAKEYIRSGDIFQCVPSQRFRGNLKGSLLPAYRMLRVINPSPYMYYVQAGELEIAGASPETLLKVQDGAILSFPIAGTRKRGATKEEDDALERELLADPKELAEHDMLVDLARNDVGRVAETGSVRVEDYRKVQRYSHVMHITSKVTGTLRHGMDALDALPAVLPAGTLSGAPKLRAMEIIDELEGERRGLYGGGIGYMGYDGNLDVCIAIRTIIKQGEDVFVQSGGGVVLDSDPALEYEETVNKAAALFKAIEEGGSL